jgi:hypothetical protein
VVRDEFGKDGARALLSVPVRKQLNRMSAGRASVDTDNLSIKEVDPKTGAERSVHNSFVGLIAGTRTAGGEVVNRVRTPRGGTDVSISSAPETTSAIS